MEEPDLSSTIWAKTLTAKQRAAFRQPYGKTPTEWLATLVDKRKRGLLVLSPQDTAGEPRGRLVVVADIERWLREEETQEGFTFFAHLDVDDKPIAPTVGSAVAMGGTELKNNRAELIGGDRKTRKRRRRRWTAWHRDMRLLLIEIGACVGGWFDPDTGEFEVSLTLVFWWQREAERFGLQQDQKAIFRFVDFLVIEIGGTGEPEWAPRVHYIADPVAGNSVTITMTDEIGDDQ